MFGLVRLITDSSRYAILAVAFFFIVAMIVLAFVNIKRGEEQALRPFNA